MAKRQHGWARSPTDRRSKSISSAWWTTPSLCGVESLRRRLAPGSFHLSCNVMCLIYFLIVYVSSSPYAKMLQLIVHASRPHSLSFTLKFFRINRSHPDRHSSSFRAQYTEERWQIEVRSLPRACVCCERVQWATKSQEDSSIRAWHMHFGWWRPSLSDYLWLAFALRVSTRLLINYNKLPHTTANYANSKIR